GLTQLAGFLIAAVGFWKLGRQLGGHEAFGHQELPASTVGNLALVSIGLAGGMGPCWDAVGLLILSAAIGRLAEGVTLVIFFSVAMAAALTAVGALGWSAKASALGRQPSPRWHSGLAFVSNLALSIMGLVLFFQVLEASA